ncbi:alkylhydroperoxidase domain protein [Winslowiella iniecta]|uniref:Alkylhydroperoxidase n=1 Tax=Winslowiella iniecta TaxID=1560201 RepID=A0A0L7T1U3_9GAMM|nr:alkylhydroperoxidase domain protein [Winslowiella iniecta]KOC89308.1 alkylhydroperoxidase [Winslowiella iniecta]KOC95361.1 alkylhydroperoxidase [Winslowiella iniecta]
MTQTTDLLAELADIDPASPLAAARQQRDAATRHSQGSYRALFSDGSADFPLQERVALAAEVAHWHQDEQLAAHYAAQPGNAASSARFQLALEHARRLTFQPVTATSAHLAALQQAGWTLDAIVTLSQIVAFVSFQSRLVRGYRLIAGHGVSDSNTAFTAGEWHTQPQTQTGKTAPVYFTTAELGWEPWIAAKPLAEFAAEQQQTLARFGHSDSDYFRLLGRNLPVLEQRTLTDKGIFYTSAGLSRAERELAAAVASKVNGCIFCASVHARKAAQLAKQPEAVQRLLDTPPGGQLSADQSSRWQAQIDFAAAISATPASASAQQIQQLRAEGLSDLELLDLLQSAAFFAWANRLMLTLGEPFIPAENHA